jgi:predicted 3-demethylubiquinone-9 3-methyltransferase (glyoxalase superfamily)
MPKITPFLWFDDNAEQAVRFYTSIFKNSRVQAVARYGAAGPGKDRSVMTISFQLAGQDFTALNGGPVFKFNEAVSLAVHCRTQREVDYYWRRLSAGGQIVECGWLKDKFGLFWQVVPVELFSMLQSKNVRKTQAVMRAMFTMKKLDLKKLRKAFKEA